MGSTQSLGSDATVHQKYNRCVSMTQFNIEESKKTYEIVAMSHREKPDKLYFILLGDTSFGFCLTIDHFQNDLGRPSFEYELDYKDPEYNLSFVTNGTLETFVEIMCTMVKGDGTTTVLNPDSYAKNLLRINEWKISEPNQEHIEKIKHFFGQRGVECDLGIILAF